ncbi:hypothetical protein L9F63_011772, partial [Diploptera punctata]
SPTVNGPEALGVDSILRYRPTMDSGYRPTMDSDQMVQRLQQQQQHNPVLLDFSYCPTRSTSPISSDSPALNTERETSTAADCKQYKESGELEKDEAYLEKRRRNNEAAKRSRDARKQKESN